MDQNLMVSRPNILWNGAQYIIIRQIATESVSTVHLTELMQ